MYQAEEAEHSTLITMQSLVYFLGLITDLTALCSPQILIWEQQSPKSHLLLECDLLAHALTHEPAFGSRTWHPCRALFSKAL